MHRRILIYLILIMCFGIQHNIVSAQYQEALIELGSGTALGAIEFLGAKAWSSISASLFGTVTEEEILNLLDKVLNTIYRIESQQEFLLLELNYLATELDRKIIEEELKDSFTTIQSLSQDFYLYLQNSRNGHYSENATLRTLHGAQLIDRIEEKVHQAVVRIHMSIFEFLPAMRDDLIQQKKDIFNFHFYMNLAILKFHVALLQSSDMLAFAATKYPYLEAALNNTSLLTQELKLWSDTFLKTGATRIVLAILQNGVYNAREGNLAPYSPERDWTFFHAHYQMALHYKDHKESPDNFTLYKSPRFTIQNPVLIWNFTSNAELVKLRPKDPYWAFHGFYVTRAGGTSRQVTFSNKYQNSPKGDWLLIYRPAQFIASSEILNWFTFYHPESNMYLTGTNFYVSKGENWDFGTGELYLKNLDTSNKYQFFTNRRNFNTSTRAQTINLNTPVLLGTKTKLYDNIFCGIGFLSDFTFDSTLLKTSLQNLTVSPSSSSPAFQWTSVDSIPDTQQWLFKKVGVDPNGVTRYVIISRDSGYALSTLNDTFICLLSLYPSINGNYKRTLSLNTRINQEWMVFNSNSNEEMSPWNDTDVLVQNSSAGKINYLQVQNSLYDIDFESVPLNALLSPPLPKDFSQRFYLKKIDNGTFAFNIQNGSEYHISPWLNSSILLNANGSSSDAIVRQYEEFSIQTLLDVSWKLSQVSSSTWKISSSSSDPTSSTDVCLDAVIISPSTMATLRLSPCDDVSLTQLWNLTPDNQYANMAYKIQSNFYPTLFLGKNNASSFKNGEEWTLMTQNLASENTILQTRLRFTAISQGPAVQSENILD